MVHIGRTFALLSRNLPSPGEVSIANVTRQHYGPHLVPTAATISALAKNGEIMLSSHALQRALARQVSADEIREVLEGCVVIADYPNDPRGHSCEVGGYTASGRYLRCVCAVVLSCGQPKVLVITAY